MRISDWSSDVCSSDLEDDSAAIVGCLYRKLSGRGLERLPMVRWLLPHRGARSAAFRACGGQSIRGPGIASATLARLSSYQGSADVMTLPYAEVIGRQEERGVGKEWVRKC